MDQAGQNISDHSGRLGQRLNNDASSVELEKGLPFLPADKTTFEQVARSQQEALRRLEQLLEALKEQQAAGGSVGRQPPGDGEGGGSGGGGEGPGADGIP